MKTLFTLAGAILFIASLLYRPSAIDFNQSIADYNTQETNCNILMVLAFFCICAAMILTGRANRKANPAPYDREFFKG